MFRELRREKLMMIPLDRVFPGKTQPRKTFLPSEMTALADSIRQNGVLQPILGRETEGGEEIIAGERRVRAAQMAGLREIPALVRTLTDSEAAVAALLENLQRQDLSFFEEAEGIDELIHTYHLTQEEAATRLGKKQSTIANKLRLLRFSPEERAAILAGGLTERHARCLLTVTDEKRRGELICQIAEQGLNVSQAEKLVASPPHDRRQRTFIAKDIRLFLNTIDHAIRVMNDSGVPAEREKTESEEFMEIRIRIPKEQVYRNRTA